MFEIRTFRVGDEEAFSQLNRAWVEELFVLEPADLDVLDHPAEHILAPGGQIFMAIRETEAVGCCALLPHDDGSYEIAKMTVLESCRGNGLGRQLLRRIIDYARERGIARLYLETNAKLKDAVHLYEAVGFQHISEDQGRKSPYERADVFMELLLTQTETSGYTALHKNHSS